jgi:hypothetical protein
MWKNAVLLSKSMLLFSGMVESIETLLPQRAFGFNGRRCSSMPYISSLLLILFELPLFNHVEFQMLCLQLCGCIQQVIIEYLEIL